MICNPLQLREIFHLEFLRWFGKRTQAGNYVLKGGVNLRLFFNSFRYSEDIDLDVANIHVDTLKNNVMKILQNTSFHDSLKPFGVERVVPPDISKAKQTQTTQRFKIHLINSAGEDFFTKVEFSRRGFKGEAEVQSVPDTVLRVYKLPPLLVPHYGIGSAVAQKIEALAGRSAVQARDVFDLYVLSSQVKGGGTGYTNKHHMAQAKTNVLGVSFEQFQDTVVSYLALPDRTAYRKPAVWDEIRLKVVQFIDEVGGSDD